MPTYKVFEMAEKIETTENREDTWEEFFEKILYTHNMRNGGRNGGPQKKSKVPPIYERLGRPKDEFTTQWAADKLGIGRASAYVKLMEAGTSKRVLMVRKADSHNPSRPNHLALWRFNFRVD